MNRLWNVILLVTAVWSGRASAQPVPQEPGWGFTWEAVGDRAINQFSYLAAGHQGRVWATGSDGVAELRTNAAGTEYWHGIVTGIMDAPFVLGDTVWFTSRPNLGRGGVYKLPIGQPWPYIAPTVFQGGAGAIQFGPPGSSGEGRLYVGSPYSVSYSDARGAPGTWTTAPGPPNSGDPTGTYAADIAFFPADGPWPNRVVYAGRWGVAISDDRGATWRTSGLWAYLDQSPQHVLTLARPGGGINVAAFSKRNGETCGCTRVYLSQDGGETWEETAQLTDDELAFLRGVTVVPMAGQPYDVPSYETQSAIALLTIGRLWRTDDGGATWSVIGQTPYEDINHSSSDILYAPDGRLYTVISSRSPTPTWVWRTADAFPVAAAPSPPAAPVAVAAVSVRPNPASGVVTVTATLPASIATATVDVVDALGRVVAILSADAIAAGPREWRVDTSEWPPGVYVVRVLAGSATATASFILTR